MQGRVLAVDDNPQIVNLTVRLLNSFGYEARGMSDPREVPAMVRSFNPEVCILDIQMPFISGSELLDSIRSIDHFTEIILLTGTNDTLLAVSLMKKGAADYLLKPIEPKQMDVAVARALEHRRLIIENTAYKLNLERLVEERSQALSDALRNLNDLHSATLETLAAAIDLRDQGTSGHSRRVADMAIQVVKKMGMDDGELMQIEHGALLHDIGKLRIPDSILWKPSDLTHEEWEIMHKHPEYGYEFVQKIGFLKEAADIILSHHERFDGTGYPRGLKGDEISFGTRIFSLVDAIDAMIYDRPYHRATAFSIACEEIRKLSGTHFDPELVEPVLEALKDYEK
ncbi:MAG: response regulator [Acidobacteria bacterium]|nr:response regulator [Acidobacteriota bacterium]